MRSQSVDCCESRQFRVKIEQDVAFIDCLNLSGCEMTNTICKITNLCQTFVIKIELHLQILQLIRLDVMTAVNLISFSKQRDLSIFHS